MNGCSETDVSVNCIFSGPSRTIFTTQSLRSLRISNLDLLRVLGRKNYLEGDHQDYFYRGLLIKIFTTDRIPKEVNKDRYPGVSETFVKSVVS